MAEKMPKPFKGTCTVNTVLVKYPHAEQATEDSAAALTYVALSRADMDPDTRDFTVTGLVVGDLRGDFQEGDTVSVTVQPQAAGTGAKSRPAKPDGIQAAREQAGYGVAAVVLVPKDAEQEAPAKPSESAKEPPKKSY